MPSEAELEAFKDDYARYWKIVSICDGGHDLATNLSRQNGAESYGDEGAVYLGKQLCDTAASDLQKFQHSASLPSDVRTNLDSAARNCAVSMVLRGAAMLQVGADIRAKRNSKAGADDYMTALDAQKECLRQYQGAAVEYGLLVESSSTSK